MRFGGVELARYLQEDSHTAGAVVSPGDGFETVFQANMKP